jgi:hypothetical protein
VGRGFQPRRKPHKIFTGFSPLLAFDVAFVAATFRWADLPSVCEGGTLLSLAAKAANAYLAGPTSSTMTEFLSLLKGTDDVKVTRADLFGRVMAIRRPAGRQRYKTLKLLKNKRRQFFRSTR